MPENDVVNQVKITRCLIYVSELLQEMIEKTEQPKYTEQDERQTIEVCTNNAEYISTFLRRIKLVMPEAKEIHYRTIIYWLETNGYINNMINEEGIRVRYITQTGKEIGIIGGDRITAYGEHRLKILLNQDAQKLILKNLHIIMNSRGHFPAMPQPVKPWTSAEDKRLEDMVITGKSMYQIQQAFGRPITEIARRL